MMNTPEIYDAEAQAEVDRQYDIASMAHQLYIETVSRYGMEPTANVLRQFRRRAFKAAAIFHEKSK